MTGREILRQLCRALSPVDVDADPAAREALLRVITAPSAWPPIVHFAGNGLVTPTLAGALERKGLFDRIPADARQYLQGMRELNRARNDLLRGELERILGWLNDIGIQPVLLKGAINLVTVQYRGCEDRVIGDLDLLVPQERLAEALECVQRDGYRVATGYDESFIQRHHHAPPLLHGSLPVSVELHRHLCRAELRPLLPTEDFLEGAEDYEWQGRALRLPGRTDRLMHTFVHAQLQDRGHAHRHLSLRALLEFAWQAQFRGEAADWSEVDRRLGATASARAAWLAWLCAAQDLFGLTPPAPFLPGRAARRRHRQTLLAMTSRPVNRWYYWQRRLRQSLATAPGPQ